MTYSEFAESIINTISTMTVGRIVFLIFLIISTITIIVLFSMYAYKQYKKEEQNIDSFLLEDKERANIFVPGISDIEKKKITFIDRLKEKILKKQKEE